MCETRNSLLNLVKKSDRAKGSYWNKNLKKTLKNDISLKISTLVCLSYISVHGVKISGHYLENCDSCNIFLKSIITKKLF